MDYIITKDDRPNWYRFYPIEQPEGDYGIDHHRVWLDDFLRAQCSDRLLGELLCEAILKWGAGTEFPFSIGKVSVSVDKGKFSFDYVGEEGEDTCH